jgi:hypothetical protein
MRGIEMPQQPEQLETGRIARTRRSSVVIRALRLLALLAMGTMLAACDRCGDFWPRSQSQIGACHSDRQP